jgi:hypothetical protein
MTPSAAFAYAPIESKADAANVPMLAPVTVHASLGGPAMWRVSEEGHVMWVLGFVQITPKNITWQTRGISAVLARAQELIDPPLVNFPSSWGSRFWSFVREASKNTDRSTLRNILPPSTYARWHVLWTKYGDGSSYIERYKPAYAGAMLYHKFLKKYGYLVPRKIISVATRYNVNIVKIDYEPHITRRKLFIAEANKALDANNFACFRSTLNLIQNDSGKIRTRGNAWAIGDINTLRVVKLTSIDSCYWYLNTQLTHQYDLGDIPEHLEAEWVSAVKSALRKNKVTVAILPMSVLLKKNGYLAALQTQGYKVESPSAH